MIAVIFNVYDRFKAFPNDVTYFQLFTRAKETPPPELFNIDPKSRTIKAHFDEAFTSVDLSPVSSADVKVSEKARDTKYTDTCDRN